MIKKIAIFVFSLFVLCVILLYIITFRVDKIAIKEENLKDNERYILVQVQYSTASNWTIIGDNTGLFDVPIDVELKGKVPNVVYDAQINNTFICYGEYLSDHINLAGYKNKVFYVTSWEIQFPVYHNSLFSCLMSNKYLYTMEVSAQ